jgi:hypothetical protein
MVGNYYDDEIDSSSGDYLKNAQEELKRVEHQVYVTLKYTRTVDVLMNVQQRMVDAYDQMFNALLFIQNITREELDGFAVLEKIKKVEEFYTDPQVEENIQIYLLMKKVLKAKNIAKESEYRRPVNLKTVINGDEVMINIDIVTHYYAVMMSFYKFVEIINKNISES